MKEHYHHGNLKNELIETSIRIISEKGFEALSLRSISAECGVSHNAIYRHFESKEQMINACRSYVTDKLTHQLETAVKGSSPLEILRSLTGAYVNFYTENPSYYSLLFRNSTVRIILSSEKLPDNYPPFELFRQYYCQYAQLTGLDEKEWLRRLMRLWALMHGSIALAISPYTQWNRDTEQLFSDIF